MTFARSPFQASGPSWLRKTNAPGMSVTPSTMLSQPYQRGKSGFARVWSMNAAYPIDQTWRTKMQALPTNMSQKVSTIAVRTSTEWASGR